MGFNSGQSVRSEGKPAGECPTRVPPWKVCMSEEGDRRHDRTDTQLCGSPLENTMGVS